MPRVTKKDCGVVNFLKKHHSDFAEVVSDLCLEGIFNGRKGDGIIFTLPSASQMKKIQDLTYSENPEQAVDLITACVIYGHAKTGNGFPVETGNKAGYKIELKKSEGNKVILNGGLELALNKDFKPMEGVNIAVWDIVSGEPILKGDKFNIKDLKKKKTVGKKKGGAESTDHSMSVRSAMLNTIQEQLANKIANRLAGKTIGGVDYSQKSVASIVNKIYLEAEKEKNIHSPYSKAFAAIASVWDQDSTVMASILLNPDSQLSNILVPAYNKLHVSGGVDSELSLNSSMEYSNYNNPQYMSKLLSNLGIKNNIAEASKLLNEKRRAIAAHYNKKEAVYNSDLLLSAYKDLYLSNKVVHGGNTVENVLPETFLQSLQDQNDNTINGNNDVVFNALGRDIMRHTLSLANQNVMTDSIPATESKIKKELAANFNDAKMYYGSSNASENAKLFLDVKEIKNIGSRAGFDALRLSFLNSTDSLYLPANIATENESVHVYGGFYNRQHTYSSIEGGKSNLSENYERILQLHS